MKDMNPRAWSIDGECWCTRVDYDGYKKEWSGIVPVFAPDNRSKYIGEYDDANIIVEFPTGLKDKNGKEIYEGDIVRVSYGYNYEVRQFRTGAWRIGRDDLYVWADSSEVIGNIHENSELLEAKNVD